MLLIFKPFPGAVFGARDRETEAMGRPYCFFQELQHGNLVLVFPFQSRGEIIALFLVCFRLVHTIPRNVLIHNHYERLFRF
jgi:hypothetical protein